MKFYICDHEGRGESPCIFTEHSWRRLRPNARTDMARCIRHGALITTVRDFPDKKAARVWARPVQEEGKYA